MKCREILLLPLLLLSITRPSASQVAVKQADTIFQDTLKSSLDITNITISPRIVVEYSNSTYYSYLTNIPTPLPDVKRIVVQYSNSSFNTHLSNIPMELSQLTKQLPSTRRLIINYAEATYYPYLFEIPLTIEDKPEINNLPHRFSLFSNYPNPFNPTTTIQYQLPKSEYVEIIIYNTLGQKIRTLVKKRKTAGTYQVLWDGKDEKGQPVASGVYIYQIKAGDFIKARKMVLMR